MIDMVKLLFSFRLLDGKDILRIILAVLHFNLIFASAVGNCYNKFWRNSSLRWAALTSSPGVLALQGIARVMHPDFLPRRNIL